MGLFWTVGMQLVVSDCTFTQPCHGIRNAVLVMVGAVIAAVFAWFVPRDLLTLSTQ
jgi:hypothetical protein